MEPNQIIKFIKAFEQKRNATTLEDDELREYNRRLLQGTGSKRSLQFRLDTLVKRFLAENPDVKQLDDRRVLNSQQRLAVYWRDSGKCNECGKQVSDKDFEVHHTEAWYQGGPTTVANSKTVCKDCHRKLTAGQR